MRCDNRTRENRLRRMAERQGLMLMKSPHHEPRTDDYDLYWLATIAEGDRPRRCCLLVSPDAGMTLDGVEEYLTYGTTRTAIMEYLIHSYGPAFVEELIKHLPQLRAESTSISLDVDLGDPVQPQPQHGWHPRR